MTWSRMLGGLTFGLLVFCCAADQVGIWDYGCTSETVLLFKEVTWSQLFVVNSTKWLEVQTTHSHRTSSLGCPGPCGAKNNTLYKVHLERTNQESDSDHVNVTLTPHEERGEDILPKDEKPICCMCKMSLLIFEGAFTFITCKPEKSVVISVRKEWKAKIEPMKETHTLITLRFISIAISCIVIILFLVVMIHLCRTRDQPEEHPSTVGPLESVKKSNFKRVPAILFGKREEDRETLVKA